MSFSIASVKAPLVSDAWANQTELGVVDRVVRVRQGEDQARRIIEELAIVEGGPALELEDRGLACGPDRLRDVCSVFEQIRATRDRQEATQVLHGGIGAQLIVRERERRPRERPLRPERREWIEECDVIARDGGVRVAGVANSIAVAVILRAIGDVRADVACVVDPVVVLVVPDRRCAQVRRLERDATAPDHHDNPRGPHPGVPSVPWFG
jgi:hypothetical protein